MISQQIECRFLNIDVFYLVEILKRFPKNIIESHSSIFFISFRNPVIFTKNIISVSV